MVYGLIGEKLGHSFSPALHAMIGDYPYETLELAQNELAPFFAARDFKGINVTIPYKTAVMPFLDEISPAARKIGAVNTVVNRGGKLYGYNTDYDGMRYLLSSCGISVAGKKVLILGSGGTSKTALALAGDLGAKQVIRVSRKAETDGTVDYETARHEHADADLLIDTTPVGMYPICEGTPVNLDDYPVLQGVIGVVYHPLRTELVERARRRGIPAVGGLAMLVAQGVRASEYFLDTRYPDTLIASIANKIEREKSHIILIGMPGVGKSTIGRVLAARLNRPFFDTDLEIVRRAGCDIPTLFAVKGEPYFRDLETAVLKEIAYEHTGAVIATGGGAPLREENRLALGRTGVVFWLTRPLSEILPTSDRPLSRDREALERRYAERRPVYSAAADYEIPVTGDPETAIQKIREVWK